MRLLRPLSLAAAVATAAAPPAAQAQRAPAGGGARATAVASTTADPATAELRGLRWRLVGPFRGGRVVAVTGSYVDPRVFYFGAVNGGVWKTTNGGGSWANISDRRVRPASGGAGGPTREISSVGAIAVAQSDPNVLWVGAGEGKPREDLTYGDGVYRSTDGGDTWTHLGLEDTHQIPALRVHPTDPDVAWVAALGHAFGPNRARGIYKTVDGGKSWKHVLYVNDSTGAADLALDPSNPRILYAAMWKFQRFPWGMQSGGGRSGLWKSTDGGETWTDISTAPGLPRTALGRIGVAVSPANPRTVYATVEAPDSAGVPRGGIFRSNDAGATWTRTSGDQRWQVRAWYYSTITADPKDEHTVYVNNLTTWRSTDGGRNWTRLRVPHGDTHILWIDPKDPERFIHGNDGGATVSYDAGATWSSIYNQPTSQFYHVTADDQFPYRLYGAQQDNTTVSIASRSDEGAVTRQDWFPVAGCENGYIAVKPSDPNVTFGGCYMGELWRHDRRTNQSRNVSVWLDNYDGWAAGDVPNRFAWTYPILYSPHDPKRLYISSQHVWTSTDEGQSWAKISPDLSRADPRTLRRSGGPIHGDMTGTEWYAMVFALAESPLVQGQLWAGSDDGLVHLTRDGGKTWANVTPTGLGAFTKISIVEPSRFDAGTAYIAANRYQQDDFRPYLLKTTDYGRTWTRIDAGIPVGSYTRSIREDPARRGLLYAGTETGVFYSPDDGRTWRSLQLNLPRASVRDLVVKGNDLAVATHGRSFWILDDLSPLRQLAGRALADSVRGKPAHLFPPAEAVRFTAGRSRRDGETGENPMAGAHVDYWVRTRPTSAVRLEFLDSAGTVLRTFTSPDSAGAARAARGTAGGDSTTVAADQATPRARGGRAAAGSAGNLAAGPGRPETDPRRTTAYGTAYDTAGTGATRQSAEADSVAYLPADSVAHARAGHNRFVWNLRLEGVRPVEGVVNDEGTYDGAMVPPGRYAVRLTVDGHTESRPFTVVDDPRMGASPAELAAAYDYTRRTVAKVNEVADAARHIADVKRALEARVAAAKGQPYARQVTDAARPVIDSLEAVRAELVDVHSQVDQITLHYPVKVYNQLLNVNRMAQSFDRAPTEQAHAVLRELGAQVDALVGRMRALERNEVEAFNRLVAGLPMPAVPVAAPAAVP